MALIPKGTMQAVVVKVVPDGEIPPAQVTTLDQMIEDLALTMITAHPLRAFSPIADISGSGQIVGALIREATVDPDTFARVTPWLLCK